MKKTIFVLTAGIALFFTAVMISCQKEEIIEQNSSVSALPRVPDFRYSKEIKAFDATKQSSVTIKVSAKDLRDLEQYSDETFEITPVYEEDYSEPQSESISSALISRPEEISIERSFIIVDQQLPNGSVGFDIKNKDQYSKGDCNGNGLWGHPAYKKITVNKSIAGRVITVVYHSTSCGKNNWNGPAGYCPANWGAGAKSFINNVNGAGIAVKVTKCSGIISLKMSNSCK